MITIDEVGELVARLEADDEARREKLLFMIRAYARILWVREPERFKARATRIRDEAGHWDNSYPPKAQLYGRSHIRAIKIEPFDYEDMPTSSGFYHTWERVTTTPGLYVTRAGDFVGAEVSGTGRVGQYAAHPGDCDREISIEWLIREDDEITTAELARIEEHLRPLAFPAS